MSLLEELNNELNACTEELRKCDEIILKQQERRTCYAERKTMLENFIISATAEQDKMNKLKSKTATDKPEPVKKPRTKASADNIETNAADAEKPVTEHAADIKIKDGVSMKDLADELHEQQADIAKISNDLGLTIAYQDGRYLFTKEQAEAIKTAMAEKKNKTV